MADNLLNATIIARGGLYTNEDSLTLAATQPGAAIRLVNFEVSQFGGYRRVNGFEYYDAANPTVPGAGKVLGVWIHNDTVYAARRNASDATSATLAVGAVSVTSGSTLVTVAAPSHGLSTGEFVTFSNIDSTLGGLSLNSTEFTVNTITTADAFTFNTSTASQGTTSSTTSNITFSISRYYSIFEHQSGSGWTNLSTAASIDNRIAVGVNKLRTTEHSFTGREVHVLVDGVNKPVRHATADFIQIYDRQGTADPDTEAQLSDPFSTTNGSKNVTVSHASHGLSTGDTVRFTNIDVDLGGQSANSLDFTVTTVNSTAEYVFELPLTSSVSSQNGVGGTAVNWFYIHETNQFDIEGASLVDDFRNHTFFAGMPNFPNFLVFSAPNNDLDFTAASGGGAINVGFPITAIAKFRDSLFIFGRDKIKRLTGNSGADFVLSEVANNTGCIAADSVIEIGGDVLFLAADGIRPLQGTARIGDVELQTISKPIQQLLRALPVNFNLDLMSSVVIRNKSQFRYFFPTETVAQPDAQGIVGGLRFADSRVGWEFGELLGIRSYVNASDLINGIETIVHGDIDGSIYKQESGNSFNGSDVIAVYATPFFYFDSSETRKTVQRVSIYTRPEGASTFNMAVYYDWDDPNKINPLSYSMSTQGALLRYFTTGGTYDSTFTFGGSTSPVLETQVQGSGRSASFVITSVGTESPYSIQGWGLTYQQLGQR